jgi:uncharacterized protein YndB with AHSA1/START domain
MDAGMEYGSLEKQITIAASPAVVYQVVSSPEHIARWWTDEANFDPTPGATGVLVWRDRARTRPFAAEIMVVDAVPGERFSFRWLGPEGEIPTAENSMLVSFRLVPCAEGTLLTVREEGMREQGWEAAVLEEYCRSHDDGWTRHLADLASYVASLTPPVSL